MARGVGVLLGWRARGKVRDTGLLLGVKNVDDFVNAYVDSFTAWDILTLFGTKEGLGADAGSIAQLIGRPHTAVESALASLAQKGFFRVERTGATMRYVWDPGDELARGLSDFIRQTSDRRGRLRALSILLRKLGRAATSEAV